MGASRQWRSAGALLAPVTAVFVGAFIGVAVFTFGYAKGFSYLSADPKACANCHIMQDYFDSWQRSSHHHVAVCVDCHLPHDFVGKYVTKADNGLFHSVAFTLDNFHEPIEIKDRNRRVVQNNCVACHVETVHEMLPSERGGQMQLCIHCHADVGHGG